MCVAFAESLVDGLWGSHWFVCFYSDVTLLYHLTNRFDDLFCVETWAFVTRFCLRINVLPPQVNGKFVPSCPNPEWSDLRWARVLWEGNSVFSWIIPMSPISRNEWQRSLPDSINSLSQGKMGLFNFGGNAEIFQLSCLQSKRLLSEWGRGGRIQWKIKCRQDMWVSLILRFNLCACFQIGFSFVAKWGTKMMSEKWFAGLFKSLHTPFTRHVVDS